MRNGIIGAGNWILDKVKIIDRWPGEGELCNITDQKIGGGGGPCNILFDIAAMECDLPLYACGVIGQDGDGAFLIDKISEKNIDDRYMYRSENLPTSFTDVMTVADNGHRTFFHNRGANAELDFEHFRHIDVDAKIFYLGYLLLLDKLDGKDGEYGTVAARVLDHMSRKGYMTVVDIVSEDSRKFKEIVPHALKYIDCLVINEVEAGCSSGIKVRDDDNTVNLPGIMESAEYLLGQGVRELVVIHYPEGAVAVEKNGEKFSTSSCNINPEDIAGSVGAGDAFCAGIVYGLHEGLPISESLKIANVSAWFNLQTPTSSDGAPTLKQILKHLEEE